VVDVGFDSVNPYVVTDPLSRMHAYDSSYYSAHKATGLRLAPHQSSPLMLRATPSLSPLEAPSICQEVPALGHTYRPPPIMFMSWLISALSA